MNAFGKKGTNIKNVIIIICIFSFNFNFNITITKNQFTNSLLTFKYVILTKY